MVMSISEKVGPIACGKQHLNPGSLLDILAANSLNLLFIHTGGASGIGEGGNNLQRIRNSALGQSAPSLTASNTHMVRKVLTMDPFIHSLGGGGFMGRSSLVQEGILYARAHTFGFFFFFTRAPWALPRIAEEMKQ